MTMSTDPASARVFVVGRNQKNGFAAEAVGDHDHYMDALFNRGSETIRGLYDRLAMKPSQTRRNTDRLVASLAAQGVRDVLETNVVCYSTPMSAHLGRAEHRGGAEVGKRIFRTLIRLIGPKVIVAHGERTADDLAADLGRPLPEPPRASGPPVEVDVGGVAIFLIPSLAPPAFNRWMKWAPGHFEAVAGRVAARLA